HTRDLGEKDLQLALALGAEVGVELPVARLALSRLAEALGVPPSSGAARVASARGFEP
ncbi:MAG: hypothetical protein ACR2LA_02255, partial [Acidimicrobiales bacterium]